MSGREMWKCVECYQDNKVFVNKTIKREMEQTERRVVTTPPHNATVKLRSEGTYRVHSSWRRWMNGVQKEIMTVNVTLK